MWPGNEALGGGCGLGMRPLGGGCSKGRRPLSGGCGLGRRPFGKVTYCNGFSIVTLQRSKHCWWWVPENESWLHIAMFSV